MESSDEIVILSRAEHEINVAKYIYEFIVVSQPLVYIHPDNEDGSPGCNPDTLAVLKKLSVQDAPTETENIVMDPRWEALKKLRDN
jgi:uncharacterized protein